MCNSGGHIEEGAHSQVAVPPSSLTSAAGPLGLRKSWGYIPVVSDAFGGYVHVGRRYPPVKLATRTGRSRPHRQRQIRLLRLQVLAA